MNTGRPFDQRVTVDANGATRSEYVYRKPVCADLSFLPLTIDTDDSRAMRYTHAARGGKESGMPTPPVATTHIDVLVRERAEHREDVGLLTTHVQVWLLANRYTLAKRDCMAHQFSFTRFAFAYESAYLRRLEVDAVREAIGTTRKGNQR